MKQEKMFHKIVQSICNEMSLVRSLGISGNYFIIEVHLTKPTVELLKIESPCYFGVNDGQYIIMKCPVIEDSSNFVCTVHKTNLDEEIEDENKTV